MESYSIIPLSFIPNDHLLNDITIQNQVNNNEETLHPFILDDSLLESNILCCSIQQAIDSKKSEGFSASSGLISGEIPPEINCNICSEKINENELIRLKCNPSKHFFCYTCILDWYKEIKKLKYTNFYTQNMCPICRKNGGLLPLINLNNIVTAPIKGIHKIVNNNEHNKTNNTIKLPVCGFKLKTKDGFCQVIGKEKYNGLCGIHCKNK